MINRRSLITGLISFAAAPAIVRASSLMPVKQMIEFDARQNLIDIRSATMDELRQRLIAARGQIVKEISWTIHNDIYHCNYLTDETDLFHHAFIENEK